MPNPARPPRPARGRARRAALALAVAAGLLFLAGWPLAAPIARAANEARHLEWGTELHPAATTATFLVNATDAPAFGPSALHGPAAGSNVSVKVHNIGVYPHSFTVAKVAGFLLDRNWSPSELNAWFNANGSLANVSVAPGATAWANFSLPASSVGEFFEFVSVVPYQFQAGMAGILSVAAGGPSVKLAEQATATFQFLPNVLIVNATKYPVVVEVDITDVGALQHTWTLSALPDVFVTPGNFSSYFTQHPPLANVQISNAGTTYNATFTLGGPGVYEYLCTIPGHFANGMNGTLWVGIQPPPPPAPLSTAIVEEGVLLGAGGLLGAAVLLAFASNYVGRFPPSRPAHGH